MKIDRDIIDLLNDEYLHWSLKQKNYRLANMVYSSVHNAQYRCLFGLLDNFKIENDKFNH